ncbi:hypothetical protein [Streptococcus mitis]|uniref:hypothetical protein n=1 Tax=Streptococcus mitis TaxID=28037 RepID=UPI001C4F0926|nr:hypothetical protein MissG1_0007 [Streptococcus phage MissG1]
MTREGIYVGGKEITQRYVGDKLVWEKTKLLFDGETQVNYDRNNRQIIIIKVFSQGNKVNIKFIEINGQKIAVSHSENRYGNVYITFTDTAEELERKTGFNRYRNYYGSISMKIYG